MAVSTKKVLRLSFSNASGNAVTITLPQPKEGITAAEIEAAMDLIIARNIFLSPGGELVSKRDAGIINTTTEDLYDPAGA
ncbi:DUF2922 domain-containing protein [Desulfosporosinus sp. PR]|uniref:DUF2922 domain-containing protein n=1 Tax=Candidatus Desulfosporosinus nitrosoreducens TaxID=3401928 RepID=UPI0027FBA1C1|nr:DUF2922 domain-containing protein [Desulfosporosinus sp. PR]MDQ7096311.1 DUF2922 domain-containing protein [Desulfosporosinus sp. PR]